MKRSRSLLVVTCLLFTGVACHRHHAADATSGDEADERPVHRGSSRAELCVESGDQYVQMPYDTNGDGAADVIRVFLLNASGTSDASTRRIVCREADVNGDGTRDVMRVYDDQARVAREQQDRDFDGRPDYWEYYEDGRLIRSDEDSNRDGRVDTRVFFDLQAHPERIERDVAARSVSGSWRPDHFEFYDHGRLVRAGEDTDFDGAVDRWDRDRIFEAELEQRERANSQPALEQTAEELAGETPDAGVNDAGRPATTAPR